MIAVDIFSDSDNIFFIEENIIMAIKPILSFPESAHILKAQSEPVKIDDPDLPEIIQDMKDCLVGQVSIPVNIQPHVKNQLSPLCHRAVIVIAC